MTTTPVPGRPRHVPGLRSKLEIRRTFPVSQDRSEPEKQSSQGATQTGWVRSKPEMTGTEESEHGDSLNMKTTILVLYRPRVGGADHA